MQQCHQCGKNIAEHEGVVRFLQTGTNREGGAHMRNVNLCHACDQKQTRHERNQHSVKLFVIIGGVAAVLGYLGYVLFFR